MRGVPNERSLGNSAVLLVFGWNVRFGRWFGRCGWRALGYKAPSPQPRTWACAAAPLAVLLVARKLCMTATGGTRGALLDFVASLKEPGAAEGRVL